MLGAGGFARIAPPQISYEQKKLTELSSLNSRGGGGHFWAHDKLGTLLRLFRGSSKVTLCREEEFIGTPPLSVCLPALRSQSRKSYGVYHILGKGREKGMQHRSGKKGIHHRGLRSRKRKKGGFRGGGVYFFFPSLFLRGSTNVMSRGVPVEHRELSKTTAIH